mgnify:CR=1 FL=1
MQRPRRSVNTVSCIPGARRQRDCREGRPSSPGDCEGRTVLGPAVAPRPQNISRGRRRGVPLNWRGPPERRAWRPRACGRLCVTADSRKERLLSALAETPPGVTAPRGCCQTCGVGVPRMDVGAWACRGVSCPLLLDCLVRFDLLHVERSETAWIGV